MTKDTITLGMQTSRDDNRTGPHVLELRKLLATHCQRRYSPDVLEFALVLRIGGEMQDFNFTGCERVRRNRKEMYITVDLGFPVSEWKGRRDEHIRKFLMDLVEIGIRCCVERLKKDKASVASDDLSSDLASVRELFLSHG